MNKQARILILGAGKSASVLIQYLQQKAVENSWWHPISAEQVKYCLNMKQEAFID